MRIDAHLHFWRPACGFDNRPVADHQAYRRDFLPTDVAPDLEACGIDGAILVQTCPQAEETDWLLDLAVREARVVGVTGWVDLQAPRRDFGPLLAQPKVVGIRAQLRRIPDSAFVEREPVVANLGAALRSGLGVTILAEARHYAPVARLLARLPDGPVTLNHLGLPFPEVDRAAWRAFMKALAAREQSFVQLSGLPFLYGAAWREPHAQALLDQALDILGPGRLMFASDWPMLTRFARYGEWTRAVEDFLETRRLAPRDRDAILGGNALRANPRLDPRAHPMQPRSLETR